MSPFLPGSEILPDVGLGAGRHCTRGASRSGVVATVTGVRLSDFSCTLKAYRREVIQEVKLNGEEVIADEEPDPEPRDQPDAARRRPPLPTVQQFLERQRQREKREQAEARIAGEDVLDAANVVTSAAVVGPRATILGATCGNLPPVFAPTPERLTICGELVALPAMTSCAVRVPSADGVNVTVNPHEEPELIDLTRN